MIDPRKMTRYGQTQNELQETILFCVSVAGKNAMTTAKGLDRFLTRCRDYLAAKPNYFSSLESPFEIVWQLFQDGVDVARWIKDAGLGCYNQRARTFKALVDSGLDLQTCTAEDLEKIPGIGLKTSRFFLLHTRPGVEVAVIDTHILKFLRDIGYPIPEKVTLSTKRYRQYEQWFLATWREEPECTLAEFDLAIWRYYSGHSGDGDMVKRERNFSPALAR